MTLAEESLRSRDALREREALFLPSCNKCKDGLEVAEGIVAEGFEVQGGEVEWSARVDSMNDTSAVVTVTRSIGPIRLIDASGSVVQQAPQSPDTTEVYQLTKSGSGEWVIASIDTLP